MTDRSSTSQGDALATVIERFDPDRHEHASLACGKPSLDQYIRETAATDERTRAAVVFVMVEASGSTAARRIIGYYTLSAFSFERDQARRRDRDRSIPAYRTVPALLIGRFALDNEYQGRGLGSTLLLAALSRALRLSENIGIAVVVVHALDDQAARFYGHQGFTAFKDEPRHLYYPIATIAAAMFSDP